MTHYDVKRLALVLAVQAENVLREQNRESPAYGEKEFNGLSDKLNNLAYAQDGQF